MNQSISNLININNKHYSKAATSYKAAGWSCQSLIIISEEECVMIHKIIYYRSTTHKSKFMDYSSVIRVIIIRVNSARSSVGNFSRWKYLMN